MLFISKLNVKLCNISNILAKLFCVEFFHLDKSEILSDKNIYLTSVFNILDQHGYCGRDDSKKTGNLSERLVMFILC